MHIFFITSLSSIHYCMIIFISVTFILFLNNHLSDIKKMFICYFTHFNLLCSNYYLLRYDLVLISVWATSTLVETQHNDSGTIHSQPDVGSKYTVCN